MTMAEEDDPFGAFGDDDNDSDQSEDENAQKIAVSLVQQANAEKKKTGSDKGKELSPAANSEGAAAASGRQNPTIELDSLQAYELPWGPPLYLSPSVKLVSNLPFGGGRGYVALSVLEPGTLVLVERPLMEWSEEQLGNELSLWSVQNLLSHPNAIQIVHDMEEFHPTKKVVDASHNEESESPEQVEKMMTYLKEKHDKDPFLVDILQLAAERNIQNKDGTPLTATDILRLFLALRYNGLESGVYTHVAMLNHNCHPNCVKFLPSMEDENNDHVSNQEFSEVRTTKWVSAGESLTISYMPKLVSHASRRRHLWEQHRFDIGGAELIKNNNTDHGRMEFINGNFPPSSKEFVDDDSITSRIERAIAEMDLMYQSTKVSLLTNKTVSDESWDQAKALEISSLELYEEAKKQLQNGNHLLLIPCLVLHLDGCDLVLRQDAKMGSLTTVQRCKLLGRQVTTARKLVDLQKAYWGQDHFDLARTYLDLAHAIEELLSKSQKHLFELEIAKSNNLTTFRDWSTLEYKYRKEYNRIKDLYPRDAAKHVANKQ